MQVRIESKGDFTIVGYETTTNYGETSHIPGMFMQLIENLPQIKHVTTERGNLGVCLRDGKEDFTYVVCIEVSAAEDLPERMVARTVAASDYAVLTHRGPIKKIGETYTYFYEKWLPENGYERPIAPFFEIYDERFSVAEAGPEAEASECDIWLPIRKRA